MCEEGGINDKDMAKENDLINSKIEAIDRRIGELQQERAYLINRLPLIENAFFAVERMGIDRDLFLGRCRKTRLAFARCAVAAYLHRYSFTTIQIAFILCRDHASVSNYLRQYERAMQEPRFYRDLVAFLEEFNKQLTIR